MSSALGITAFIVMLIVVVLIHEAAHFGFAKLFGFKVEEFFVGFGKRLWSTRRGETEYGVKAIPAGGYVKIAGMDPYHPVPVTHPDHARTYYEKPAWQRAIVIAAGPLTHFVIAFVFFAVALTFAGGLLPAGSVTFSEVERTFGAPFEATDTEVRANDRVVAASAGSDTWDPTTSFGAFVREHEGRRLNLTLRRDTGDPEEPTIETITTSVDAQVFASPADEAGLRPGDRVLEASAGTDRVVEPGRDAFVTFLRSHERESIDLVVERNGRSVPIRVVPRLVPTESETTDGVRLLWRIGVVPSDAVPEPSGFPASLVDGARMVWFATTSSVAQAGEIFGPEGIGRMSELLFTDAEREVTDPASAIGLAGAAGELSAGGKLFQLLFLFGGINVFVGLLNLLPLPPFDGGHLAVVAIEKIRGKRIDTRRLIPIAAVVLTFFVLFTSAAVLVDITKPLRLGP